MIQNKFFILIFNPFFLRCSSTSTSKQEEEFSDNDNADNYDEYDPIHNGIYQNGYLPHTDAEDNQNVDFFRKQFNNNNKNTNTSSSKSSSSNNSEIPNNSLPHYQPRWHQQLNNPFHIRNPLNSAYIKAHLDSVNREIAQLNLRMESILLKQHQVCNNTEHTARNDVSLATEQQQQQQPRAQTSDIDTIGPSAIYRDPVDSMVTTSVTVNDTRTVNDIKMPTNPITLSSPSLENKSNKLPTNISPSGYINTSGGNIAATNKSYTHRQLPSTTNTTNVTTNYTTNMFTNVPHTTESETEHIYETIPEDSESEPIYCSPYRGDDDSEQQLVAEWLTVHQTRSSLGGGGGSGILPWSRTTKSISSMEDHENSSSAYNTGGSCNSNHQLTLDLSDSAKDGNKTLTFCPIKHVPPKFGHTQNENSRQNSNAMTRSASKKVNKTLSPTHNNSQRYAQQQQEHAGIASDKGNLSTFQLKCYTICTIALKHYIEQRK